MIIEIEKKYTGKENIKIKIKDNKDIWSFNNNINNLKDVFLIEKLNIPQPLHDKYKKLIDQLNICENISWVDLIGSNNLNKQIVEFKENIKKLKNRNLSYYRFLAKRNKLSELISTSLYNDESYNKPVYNHSSTVTGRSVIKKGLNFLTMKKNLRNNLSSRFVKGKIVELDIVSLEPRVLSKIMNVSQVDDYYSYVAKNVVNSESDRGKIKLGLLAIMYGAGTSTVKKLSGLNNVQIEKIREYFKINELQCNLKKEIFMKNI